MTNRNCFNESACGPLGHYCRSRGCAVEPATQRALTPSHGQQYSPQGLSNWQAGQLERLGQAEQNHSQRNPNGENWS